MEMRRKQTRAEAARDLGESIAAVSYELGKHADTLYERWGDEVSGFPGFWIFGHHAGMIFEKSKPKEGYPEWVEAVQEFVGEILNLRVFPTDYKLECIAKYCWVKSE